MKHGQEKSDLFIVALKPTNKPGRLAAELVEPRERTEGNMGEQHTYRTLRRIKRVPEARLCTRSCSWVSSLTTRDGSPVRESRPPGSVRGASSNGCPYRDRPSKDQSTKRKRSRIRLQLVLCDDWHGKHRLPCCAGFSLADQGSHSHPPGDFAPYRALFSVSCAHELLIAAYIGPLPPAMAARTAAPRFSLP